MTPGGKPVTLIAAVAENGVIGLGSAIPWHLPEDFAHFKRTTVGHTLIMGRTTQEGIGRPLPDRTTIVLTADESWSGDGLLVAHSLFEAFEIADDLPGEVMVGGGAAVYDAAMPYADVQVISEVHQRPEGDTYYPYYDPSLWRETARERGAEFDIVRLEKVSG